MSQAGDSLEPHTDTVGKRKAAQQLAYATPASSPRSTPGLLIALAVISLLVALLSFVVSIGSSLAYLGAWRETYDSARLLPVVLPPTTLKPYSGLPPGPRGFPPAQRRQIVDSMRIEGAFADDYREMIDRLMAEVGMDMVTPSGGNVAPTSPVPVRQPSAGESAQFTRMLPNGRLVFGVNMVNFYPADRPGACWTAGADGFIDRTGQQRWLIVAMDQFLTELLAGAPDKQSPTPMQVAYIADLLAKTKPDTNVRPLLREFPRQINVQSDGLVRVAFGGGKAHLVLPDGRGVLEEKAPNGIDVATGRLKAPQPASPAPPAARVPLLLSALFGGLGVLMAIGLILAAAMVFARPIAGIVFLRRWATAKCVLVCGEIILLCWSFDIIAAAQYDRGAFPRDIAGTGIGLLTGAGMILVFGLSWPAIVLATLRGSGSIRAYQLSCGVADPDSPDPWRYALRNWMEMRLGGPVPRRLGWAATAGAAFVAVLHLWALATCAKSTSRWDSSVATILHGTAALVAAVCAVVLLVRTLHEERSPTAVEGEGGAS